MLKTAFALTARGAAFACLFSAYAVAGNVQNPINAPAGGIVPGHIYIAGPNSQQSADGGLVISSTGNVTDTTVLPIGAANATAVKLGTLFSYQPYITQAKGADGTAPDCTGVADNTAVGVAALAQWGVIHVPRDCTINLNTVNLPSNALIVGDGLTSIIKHRASATGHMLVQANDGSTTTILNVTLDGNYLNNGGDTSPVWSTFRLTKSGATAANPSTVIIDNVAFINGARRDADMFVSSPTVAANWLESNTQHLGGANGGSAEGLGPVNANFVNIRTDPGRLPTGATGIGHGGVLIFGDPAVLSNINASVIQCNDTGISSSSGTLGCMDAYEYSNSFILTNATSLNAVGRGFTTKADTFRTEFSDIVVTNVQANPSNPSGNSLNGCVGINQGVVASVGGYVRLSNITCTGSGRDGIFSVTSNGNSPVDAVLPDVLIDGFLIDGCGAGRYGISIVDPLTVRVSNGIIGGCSAPINVTSDGLVAEGRLAINNVQMLGAGKPQFDAQTKTNGMWYWNNQMLTPFSAADLTQLVSANTIIAWTPTLYANTGAGAQVVSTISNVPDGQTVTLYASSASNSLTIQSGGNLNIQNPPLVISDVASSITFRSVAGQLYEISRSTPSIGTANVVASGVLNLTNRGGAGSPAVLFGADTNSGLYSTGANIVNIAISGNREAQFQASGLTLYNSTRPILNLQTTSNVNSGNGVGTLSGNAPDTGSNAINWGALSFAANASGATSASDIGEADLSLSYHSSTPNQTVAFIAGASGIIETIYGLDVTAVNYGSSTAGAGTQTFTNSPCSGLATERWMPFTITGQAGTWYVPACQ